MHHSPEPFTFAKHSAKVWMAVHPSSPEVVCWKVHSAADMAFAAVARKGTNAMYTIDIISNDLPRPC